jgi:ABC-type Na+ transport system ATPase subunit NatA
MMIDNLSLLFFNTAVNCVSLVIENGSILGFIGANGAKNTMLIKMTISLLHSSDDHIFINSIVIEKH